MSSCEKLGTHDIFFIIGEKQMLVSIFMGFAVYGLLVKLS